MEHIPLDKCERDGIYKLHARNIKYGVFNEEAKAFIGIRQKFGNRFLDTEYHWDTGAPFGTARPLELVGWCGDEEKKKVFEYLDKLPDFDILQ